MAKRVQIVFLLTILLKVVLPVDAAPFNGNGPGESTIGVNGDYPSLFAASEAINAHTLTGGDWTFLVLNDLVETYDTIIGPPAISPYHITFRPAPGTQPTVTYTSLNSGVEAPAHVNIGINLTTEDGYQAAHNIVIDGSNEQGVDRRDLTLTNISNSRSRGMIFVAGESDNVVIKNCRIYSYATDPATGFKESMDYTVNFSAREDFFVSPTRLFHSNNGAILNCDIQTTGSVRYAITYNYLDMRFGDYMSYEVDNFSSGILIAHNNIKVLGGGIGCDLATQATITSNTIDVVPHVIQHYFTAGITMAASVNNQPESHLLVSNNTVRYKIPSPEEYPEFFVAGIHMQEWMTPLQIHYAVYNNLISSDGYYMERGIAFTGVGAGSIDIAHNSIAFPEEPGTTPDEYPSCSGIEISASQPVSSATIKNNIIYAASPRVVCLKHYASTGNGLEPDYNNYYTANGGSVLYDWSTHYTLAQWQAASGKDQHSISQNPFAPAEPGAGTWVGPGGAANPDMRFTSMPGAIYHAPRLTDVLADIDGNPRPENATVMGAHQPLDTSSIGAWALY